MNPVKLTKLEQSEGYKKSIIEVHKLSKVMKKIKLTKQKRNHRG